MWLFWKYVKELLSTFRKSIPCESEAEGRIHLITHLYGLRFRVVVVIDGAG